MQTNYRTSINVSLLQLQNIRIGFIILLRCQYTVSYICHGCEKERYNIDNSEPQKVMKFFDSVSEILWFYSATLRNRGMS